MQNTLSELWYKHDLLSNFKNEMNKLGYVGRDLYCLQTQIDLLKEFIELESINVLGDLITKKTYFRLLKHIDRGIEYLPDIILNSESWILNPIDKDTDAWIDKDVLIFSTKTNMAVFSKISRKDEGYSYVTQYGKWQ